jgi:2-keto-4-pentenoate hydratase/2-oxohepta-3-ene-1,7-dioic acid hydratase in catechol pathway
MEKTRFVRTAAKDRVTWAVVEGDVAYRLDTTPFDAWTRGEALGRLEELALLAPTTPTKIVCVGRNYPAHAAEHAAEVPTEPLLFFKPPSSVIGPGVPIVLTPQSEQVEHESELVVVIGRRCRNVSPEETWSHVLGITCGNDVTARDLQRQDSQWTRAKGFDTFCPLGPWLVAGLSEQDVADLEVTCQVNGKVRQRGNTGEKVFSPAQLIAYISAIMTLEPGDAIMTGTPAGVGPLIAGDEVMVEVAGVGILKNPVTW